MYRTRSRVAFGATTVLATLAGAGIGADIANHSGISLGVCAGVSIFYLVFDLGADLIASAAKRSYRCRDCDLVITATGIDQVEADRYEAIVANHPTHTARWR